LIDDYIIGAFLLVGLWLRRRNPARGHAAFAAALGFVCAFGYGSFFGHLQALGTPDAGRIPRTWLIGAIGIGWLMTIAALLQTLLWRPEEAPNSRSSAGVA
jgi:hypothetical protein